MLRSKMLVLQNAKLEIASTTMSPYIQTHTHTHVCVCNYLFYVTKTVKPLSDLRLNYKVVVGARAAHMEERGSLSCQTFKY